MIEAGTINLYGLNPGPVPMMIGDPVRSSFSFSLPLSSSTTSFTPNLCSYRKLRLTGKLTHYCRVTARKVTPFAARPTHPACPALAQHASLMQEKERRVPSRVVRALMGGRAFVALA
jgi:hypothetical protein